MGVVEAIALACAVGGADATDVSIVAVTIARPMPGVEALSSPVRAAVASAVTRVLHLLAPAGT